MELIKPGTNFDFIGKMRIFGSISAILVIASILFLVLKGGPNLGIDFAGGTSLQIQFKHPTSVDNLRSRLATINLEKSTIQQVGARERSEFLIRTDLTSSDLKGITDKVEEALAATYGRDGFEVRRAESVGPKAGSDLRTKGILAVCFSFVGMLIYIAWRYEFRFGLGGVVALIHDVTITLGIITLLGMEFTLTIIAGLLTLIGYSINDTVVVFDRIRENIRKSPGKGLAQSINESVNQTLSRTILVSLTVFLVLLALFFFGGTVIKDFALTLLIGVVVGTYSSIFIASPVVLIWDSFRKHQGKGGITGALK